MTIPAHLAGGYLALSLANRLYPELGLTNSTILVVGVVGAVFPDIDALFSTYLRDHHSFIHVPLFWLIAFVGLFLLMKLFNSKMLEPYLLSFAIGIATHLFLDWFSGRSAGIQLLYPLSLKEYSLYPLQPERGKVPISLLPSAEYLSFYKENVFLFASEIMMTITAIVVAVVRYSKAFLK